MSVRTLYLSRTIVQMLFAPKTRAIAFFVVCALAAVGLYIAGSPQQKLQSGAVAAEGPPVVRVDRLHPISARVAAVGAAAAMKPVMAPALPRDKATLVRQLQSALAHAGCYDGDISGTWTSASREAMQKFVNVVNAQLPVTEPDTTLLALVGSNTESSCKFAAPATTGSLAENPSVVERPVAVAAARNLSGGISLTGRAGAAEDRTSMLDYSWAPTGMLTGTRRSPADTKRGEVPPPAVEALIVGSSEPDTSDWEPASVSPPVTAGPQAVTVAAPKVAEVAPVIDPAPRNITLKIDPDDIEEAKAASKSSAASDAANQTDRSTASDDDDDASKPATKSHSKKSKSTKAAKSKSSKKRTAPVYAKQGGPQSLSQSFDSLARTVSSLFD